MPEASAETQPRRAIAPAGSPARPAWRLRVPRLGIGWRLILGLTAVAAVLIGAQVLATRTTREALDAVRSMQNEHEPVASAANLHPRDQICGSWLRQIVAEFVGAAAAGRH